MPEINETSPVEGEADRKGDVEYIAYIGPPEFPLLVDRDKEVLALPEKMNNNDRTGIFSDRFLDQIFIEIKAIRSGIKKSGH